jgi:hypothetical protein
MPKILHIFLERKRKKLQGFKHWSEFNGIYKNTHA